MVMESTVGTNATMEKVVMANNKPWVKQQQPDANEIEVYLRLKIESFVAMTGLLLVVMMMFAIHAVPHLTMQHLMALMVMDLESSEVE